MSQPHFPSSLSQPAINHHHLDSSLLSMPCSPPSNMDAASGTSNFTLSGNQQRKFTLLARPQPQLSNTVSMSYQQNMPSPDQYNGLVLDGPCLNQSSLIPPPPGSVQGRATRDDYYDTEDPSVNLQDFIVNSMQAQKNRVILIKLEEEFIAYIANHNCSEPLKLPPWDSYHRMLAHRVAAYFGLEHNVDPMDKMRVIVGKGPNTRLPQIRFGDYLSLNDDSDSPEPKLILKRAPSEPASVDHKFESVLVSMETTPAEAKLLKSFEKREEEYEKARAQIFSQQSPIPSVLPFDLATSNSPRLTSSIFHSAMHHRRAASDTAMFKRLAPADAKKEGSSSNQGSRSATPLISSMLKAAGSCELHFPSFSSRVQPPLQAKTSPVQQQVHGISVFDNQGQPSHYHSQTTSSAIISSSPSNFHITSSSTPQVPCPSEQPNVTTITDTSPTAALHYQPVQQQQEQQAALPVLYGGGPSQHPQQASVLADPSWYAVPYQQMLLYQMPPPQGYVPAATHYVGGGSPHMIPGAMYHPYPVTPGVIGQHGMISPPATSPQQQFGTVGSLPRLPMAPLDHLTNHMPHHNSSAAVALVKPVPQQASPVGVAKLDGTWSFPPPGPGQHFNMSHSMVAQQIMSPSSGQHTVVPVSPHLSAANLADQLGNTLHITTSNGDCGGNIVPETDSESVIPRASSSIMPKMKSVAYSDVSEVDSGILGHVMSRMPSGPFPMGGLPLAGDHTAIFGGQMISPTHPQGPVHFLPPQPAMYGSGRQEGAGYVNSQSIMPNSALHLPAGTPSQPATPTIGPPNQAYHNAGSLNLATANLLQAQQQGIFSPTTTVITHSPVQILGHTLGTGLFSPPPSTGNQHGGMFINSPISSRKVGYSPNHPPPVGSDSHMRQFESPAQTASHVSDVPAAVSTQSANGYHSLPPRLAQQQGQRSGNRYQNQRHPSNRPSAKESHHGSSSGSGSVTLGDHMPSQFVGITGSSGSGGGGGGGGGSSGSSYASIKREALLPTPPSNQMVKLDTNLTCGVPLNVMEVVGYPLEGCPERAQAYKVISKLSGLIKIQTGKMTKSGEEVTIAVFSNQDAAMQGLQAQLAHLSLSIPGNNHAKFILTML